MGSASGDVPEGRLPSLIACTNAVQAVHRGLAGHDLYAAYRDGVTW